MFNHMFDRGSQARPKTKAWELGYKFGKGQKQLWFSTFYSVKAMIRWFHDEFKKDPTLRVYFIKIYGPDSNENIYL